MYQAFVGKSFCFINLLQSEFDCYKKNVQSYNKIPWGGRGTLKGCLVYCQGLQPSSYLIQKKNVHFATLFKRRNCISLP